MHHSDVEICPKPRSHFNNVYTACSHLSMCECLCYRMFSFMTRWLPRDIINMPLGTIDAEISSIEKKPMRDRTISDAERLADLHDARRRIAGSGCGRR